MHALYRGWMSSARAGAPWYEEAYMSLREIARALYDASPRAYHNWEHVEACLRELASVRGQCDRPDLVEIALWFHDAVYDPRRSDNEARSADAAKAGMREEGFGDADIAIVRRLILNTRHAETPATGDGKLIADIDLAILGQPADVFAAYEAAIRREYAHVSDADFAAGRAAALQKFLERRAIYYTDVFRERYDQVARGNLTRAIERWASHAD
jgi:predicted metal-dependent HD superfamily phosphohydrolase